TRLVSDWSSDVCSSDLQAFDAMDTNHDGFVDRDEFNAYRAKTMATRMGEGFVRYLDTNQDGKVTREEFGKLVQLFDALDTDHDRSEERRVGKECETEWA